MFDLNKLLDDKNLANQYAHGSLLLSRLCPIDCHHFHFPASCVPYSRRLIIGPLYSVNLIALCHNILILAKQSRQHRELCIIYKCG
jgi:phosphatidylserine decarboxylase